MCVEHVLDSNTFTLTHIFNFLSDFSESVFAANALVMQLSDASRVGHHLTSCTK